MRVNILKLDHFGRGICNVDGKVCFVNNALIDEDVSIKIIANKKKYLVADVKDYYKLSEERVNPICPLYDKCGGCDLLHYNYYNENIFKYNKVKNIVNRYANISSYLIKNIVYDKEYNYRNKVILHCIEGVLGFYKKNSNDIVNVKKCFLLDDKINKVIEILNTMDLIDVKEVVIKVSNDSKKVFVNVIGNINDYGKLLNYVDNLIIDGKIIKGNNFIITNIGRYKFYLYDKGFFQVNKFVTEKLYDEVYNIVKESNPNNVLDLYCGAGTIGIYISELVKNIIGVESCKESIIAANKNKDLNNCNHIKFINNKVENVIKEINNNIDLVIVDPPRAGLDKNTVDTLLDMDCNTIIYVSCDPVTMSRDLKDLMVKYSVEYIKPFNMFPKTYHVECVSVLHRKVNE